METNQELAIETNTVEQTLDALRVTWNLHDMDACMALFCPEADFVNVLGMRLKGRAAIDAVHRELHRERFAKTHITVLDQSIAYLGTEIALAHVKWEMTGDTMANGDGVRRGMMTHVLIRRDGQWLFRATQNTDIVQIPEMMNHPFWQQFV